MWAAKNIQTLPEFSSNPLYFQIFTAESLNNLFDIKLIFVVWAVELTGLSSQLDGLRHSHKLSETPPTLIWFPLLYSPDLTLAEMGW